MKLNEIINNLEADQYRSALYSSSKIMDSHNDAPFIEHVLERGCVRLSDTHSLSIIYGSFESLSRKGNKAVSLKIVGLIEADLIIQLMASYTLDLLGKWIDLELGVFEQLYLRTMLKFGEADLQVSPDFVRHPHNSKDNSACTNLLDMLDFWHGSYAFESLQAFLSKAPKSDFLHQCTHCKSFLDYTEYLMYKRDPKLIKTTDGYVCKSHWCECMPENPPHDYLQPCDRCKATYICRGCKVFGGASDRICCNCT